MVRKWRQRHVVRIIGCQLNWQAVCLQHLLQFARFQQASLVQGIDPPQKRRLVFRQQVPGPLMVPINPTEAHH